MAQRISRAKRALRGRRRQDRGLWDTREIAEGVSVVQSALARQTDERRPGRYRLSLSADAERGPDATRRRARRRQFACRALGFAWLAFAPLACVAA